MLTQLELDTLESQGYLNLGPLLSPEGIKVINERIKTLLDTEGDKAGSELVASKFIRHPKEAGVDRLADLVNKGEVFDVFYTHPKVLAAMEFVLGPDFKLSSLNYRSAKPGMGLQKLHVDWKNTIPDGKYKVCNSIWLLDDFTEHNGSTRIVPGTHKANLLPDQVMDDPNLKHLDEVRIIAPAGTVYIFNSHVWHGGTLNETNKERRSIHSYFCAGDQPQQIDQRKYITRDTMDRIGKRGLKILDVE